MTMRASIGYGRGFIFVSVFQARLDGWMDAGPHCMYVCKRRKLVHRDILGMNASWISFMDVAPFFL